MSYSSETPERHVADLWGMLSLARPSRSWSEEEFIERFIAPLCDYSDKFGNYIARIGDAPVAWCAHTDSVHRVPGKVDLVWTDSKETVVRSKTSSCLGADNAAGCWVLREMILAQRPGLYLFHREEESGCKGSSYIAENDPELLSGIKMAIAFDRRGTKSIITHQMPGRTCSDAFGLSLAKEIGMDHELDDGGTYTDTASYIDLIGECTNVSVGYASEHSSNERLDVDYLMRLRAAMLDVDVGRIECFRKPGERETRRWANRRDHMWGDDDLSWHGTRYDRYLPRTEDEILRFVKDNPEEVASFLEDMGVDIADLRKFIFDLN
jgi:hypothetical protein